MEEKHKGLSHDSQCQSQDVNLGLPKYDAGVQTNMVNHSIIRVLIWDLLRPHFIAYMYNLFNKSTYTLNILSHFQIFIYLHTRGSGTEQWKFLPKFALPCQTISAVFVKKRFNLSW